MHNHTLLIIEDDVDLARSYREIFHHRGWHVVSAPDGESAIDRAVASNPTVILLDLMLPKQGGLAALKILRSLPETRDLPIVIVTAYPNPEYREEALRSGATMFFLKSEVSHAQLADQVESLVKEQHP